MILEVRDLYTSYGLSQILFGISLAVHERECVALLGLAGLAAIPGKLALQTVVDIVLRSGGKVKVWHGWPQAGIAAILAWHAAVLQERR